MSPSSEILLPPEVIVQEGHHGDGEGVEKEDGDGQISLESFPRATHRSHHQRGEQDDARLGTELPPQVAHVHNGQEHAQTPGRPGRDEFAHAHSERGS